MSSLNILNNNSYFLCFCECLRIVFFQTICTCSETCICLNVLQSRYWVMKTSVLIMMPRVTQSTPVVAREPVGSPHRKPRKYFDHSLEEEVGEVLGVCLIRNLVVVLIVLDWRSVLMIVLVAALKTSRWESSRLVGGALVVEGSQELRSKCVRIAEERERYVGDVLDFKNTCPFH